MVGVPGWEKDISSRTFWGGKEHFLEVKGMAELVLCGSSLLFHSSRPSNMSSTRFRSCESSLEFFISSQLDIPYWMETWVFLSVFLTSVKSAPSFGADSLYKFRKSFSFICKFWYSVWAAHHKLSLDTVIPLCDEAHEEASEPPKLLCCRPEFVRLKVLEVLV